MKIAGGRLAEIEELATNGPEARAFRSLTGRPRRMFADPCQRAYPTRAFLKTFHTLRRQFAVAISMVAQGCGRQQQHCYETAIVDSCLPRSVSVSRLRRARC
jgi:hypothetical protein